jgi:hypothetical protein
LPEARTVPLRGRPPSMTKDCMARAMLLAVFNSLIVPSLAVEMLDVEFRHRASRLEAEYL